MNNEHRLRCGQLSRKLIDLQAELLTLVRDIELWTPLTNAQGSAKIQELQELKSAVTETTLSLEYIDNAIKI